MLRWLDHAQVEGIGGIIDHFYAEFVPTLEAVSLRSLEGAHYYNTGMPSLNNSPGVLSVSNAALPILSKTLAVLQCAGLLQ